MLIGVIWSNGQNTCLQAFVAKFLVVSDGAIKFVINSVIKMLFIAVTF